MPLDREVPNRNPVGSASSRRISALFVAARCAHVGLALGMPTLVQERHPYAFFESEVATLFVRHYADEAFLLWTRANPGRTCPDHLLELAPFIGATRNTLDPWG